MLKNILLLDIIFKSSIICCATLLSKKNFFTQNFQLKNVPLIRRRRI